MGVGYGFSLGLPLTRAVALELLDNHHVCEVGVCLEVQLHLVAHGDMSEILYLQIGQVAENVFISLVDQD